MSRKAFIFSAIFVFLISLAGCATTRKNSELEIQGLRNQISVLEAQIQSKDDEINSLRESLVKGQAGEKPEATKDAGKKKGNGEAKMHPTMKQIQTALSNAGYNPGPIDGRKGHQTRAAIKAFQKANNLKETGKADKETWDLLKEYLNKKVK